MRQYQAGLDVNSERYQELEADIRSNESAIWDAQRAQLEWNEAIAKIPLTTLQYALKAIQNIKSSLEGMNDLHVAQGLDPTREYYQELVDLGMQEIINMEDQNRLLRERLIGMDVESEKWQEINDEIKSNEQAILEMKVAQEEWVDAIVDIKIDELKKMRQELEKTNDTYRKRVELEKAIENLERAKQQRTKLVYKEGVGFVYARDEKAVREATEALADKRHDEMLDKLDKIVDTLEDSKKDNNVYDYNGNLLTPVDWAERGVDLDALYEGLVDNLKFNPLADMYEQMTRDVLSTSTIYNNGGVTVENVNIEVNGAGDPEAVGNAVVKKFSDEFVHKMPLVVAQQMTRNR